MPVFTVYVTTRYALDSTGGLLFAPRCTSQMSLIAAQQVHVCRALADLGEASQGKTAVADLGAGGILACLWAVRVAEPIVLGARFLEQCNSDW